MLVIRQIRKLILPQCDFEQKCVYLQLLYAKVKAYKVLLKYSFGYLMKNQL